MNKSEKTKVQLDSLYLTLRLFEKCDDLNDYLNKLNIYFDRYAPVIVESMQKAPGEIKDIGLTGLLFNTVAMRLNKLVGCDLVESRPNFLMSEFNVNNEALFKEWFFKEDLNDLDRLCFEFLNDHYPVISENEINANLIKKELKRLQQPKARARNFSKCINQCYFYFKEYVFLLENRAGCDWCIKLSCFKGDAYKTVAWASDYIYDSNFSNKNLAITCLKIIKNLLNKSAI